MSPPCRKKNETQKACVARKVPEIAAEHPDWPNDQVVAVAFSMCSQRCRCETGDEAMSIDTDGISTGVIHRTGIRLLDDPVVQAPVDQTTFLASDDGVDRYRTRITQDWLEGGRIEAFDANPVVPWSHDYSDPPIGRVVSREVRAVGDGRMGLVVTIGWDMEDPEAASIAGKYARGVLSAVSVGFRSARAVDSSGLPPQDPWYTEPSGNVTILRENSLLEISAVTIPGNPRALAQREARWLENGMLEAAPAHLRQAIVDAVLVDDRLRNLIAEIQGDRHHDGLNAALGDLGDAVADPWASVFKKT